MEMSGETSNRLLCASTIRAVAVYVIALDDTVVFEFELFYLFVLVFGLKN